MKILSNLFVSINQNHVDTWVENKIKNKKNNKIF